MPLSERDRRTLIIGGVIVGVLLVGLLLFTLLSGGGGEGALPSFPPPGSPPPSTTPSSTPTTAPHPVQMFSGRDPFSKPGAFAVSSSSSTGSPTGSGSGTGTGTQTSSTSSPPPTQPGNGSTQSIGGHQVVLLDTFRANGQTRAQVEIDGTVYNVAMGESFGPGGRFELRSVSGDCATFVFGDESFTLCTTPQK